MSPQAPGAKLSQTLKVMVQHLSRWKNAPSSSKYMHPFLYHQAMTILHIITFKVHNSHCN